MTKLDYDRKSSTEKTRACWARILARIPQARIPRQTPRARTGSSGKTHVEVKISEYFLF